MEEKPLESARPEPAASDAMRELRVRVEQVSAENLVLRQHGELSTLFAKHEKEWTTQFDALKKDVDSNINRRLVALSVVGIGLLVVAWYKTITPIREIVQQRLDKEFSSDNIRGLISNAAQKAASVQAAELMNTTLKPATDKALADIQQHRDEVSNIAKNLQSETDAATAQVRGEMTKNAAEEKGRLDALRAEYSKQLADLKSVAEVQRKLNDIEVLKAQALVDGDYASYSKLLSYSDSDKTLVAAANAAILDTKIAATGDRIHGMSIWMLKADGSQGATNEAISTNDLVSTFLLVRTELWQHRAKAAQLLGARREAVVPPALLLAINSDPNLWVRRTALVSFQQVTGFLPDDVFAFEAAQEWWNKNREDYLKSVKPR